MRPMMCLLTILPATWVLLGSPAAADVAAAPWRTVYESSCQLGTWTSTDPDVYVSGGVIHWFVDRQQASDQYVWTPLCAAFTGDVRITVVGRIDTATNNSRCTIGVGSGADATSVQQGVSLNFGWYGGGCPTHGFLINADEGVHLNNLESYCVFTGTFLWVNPSQTYTAVLAYLPSLNTVHLDVPGVGSVEGTPTYAGGPYNKLYVGMRGNPASGWGACSGSIDYVRVETRSPVPPQCPCNPLPISSPSWGQVKALYR
jgi:hypothetical protein